MSDTTAQEFLYIGKGKLAPQCEKWFSCDEYYVKKIQQWNSGPQLNLIFSNGVEKTRSKYAYCSLGLFLLHWRAKGTAPELQHLCKLNLAR
jgi:hypothetical protein